MKNQTTTVYTIIAFATVVLGTGCFSVKNTTGIQAAYHDIELAYPKAKDVKAEKKIDDKTKKQLKDEYDSFRADVNAYLKAVQARASDYTVDESEDVYKKDKARASGAKFIADARKALGIAPEGAPAVLIAAAIIEEIVKLNGEAQKQAYDRFQKVIDDNLAKEWDAIQ